MVVSLPVIILILLLITAVLVIAHLYARLTTAYTELEKEEHKLQSHIHHRSAYLIDETKKKSLKILGDANVKAQELINQAQLIDVSAKDTFAQQMQEVAAKQKASLEALIQQLEAMHKEVVTAAQKDEQKVAATMATTLQQEAGTVTTTLQQEVNTEIASFAKTLEGETVTYQKMVEQKVSAEYQRIQKELEAYKAERMKQFDARLPQLLSSVIERIVGRVISLQDHEKLIMQALETAKKEQLPG